MAPNSTRRYSVRLDTGSPTSMAGFLDMMRYERAQVETWDEVARPASRALGATYMVQLVSSRFTPDRWRSFGFVPMEMNDD